MVNGLPDIKELPPLDVWEKTEFGIFDRSHVISEVEISGLTALTRSFVQSKNGSTTTKASVSTEHAPLLCRRS